MGNLLCKAASPTSDSDVSPEALGLGPSKGRRKGRNPMRWFRKRFLGRKIGQEPEKGEDGPGANINPKAGQSSSTRRPGISTTMAPQPTIVISPPSGTILDLVGVDSESDIDCASSSDEERMEALYDWRSSREMVVSPRQSQTSPNRPIARATMVDKEPELRMQLSVSSTNVEGPLPHCSRNGQAKSCPPGLFSQASSLK